MDDLFLYTCAHPRYFETPGRASRSTAYTDLLKTLLPKDWIISPFDIWLDARSPQGQTADQGFKIHVSACLSDAVETIKSVIPVLVEANTPFKVLADSWLHRLSNSKRFPRPSSGKFITIYPATHDLFTAIVRNLASATRDIHGPYILSDRRYEDSTVIYYRYGGFKRINELLVDGTRRLLIRNGEGRLIPDERMPFFHLPEGIADPFHNNNRIESNDGLLNGRFRIEAALNFTNTGGVYRAIDVLTDSPVVIKEARPYTVIPAGPGFTLDAIEAQRRERDSLEALKGLNCVPLLIENFIEWEHHFLVESYVDGMTLASLRAQADFIFMERIGDAESLIASCDVWKKIGLQLLAALDSVHSRGVLIGDISPINVLWNRSTEVLTFVDLESACRLDGTVDEVDFNTRWSFPGFRSQAPQLPRTASKLNDYYASGMLLYNLVCPVHVLFELDKTFPRNLFLEYFVEAGLPATMARVIYALLDGDAAEALAKLSAFSPSQELGSKTEHLPVSVDLDAEKKTDAVVNHIGQSLSEVLASLTKNILASADFTRDDRLWPADPLIFSTNPLSLAYGAAGTALFLSGELGTLPNEISTWLVRKEVTPANYPPGLYLGMSGIAWVYSQIGWIDRAKKIMKLALTSRLAFESPTMFDGVAGWGFAALALFASTEDEEFMAIARTAGDHLIATKRVESEGWCWTSLTDKSANLGMGFGASGIALFLLNLWAETQSSHFLHAAKHALEFEIAHGKERNSDGALLWGYSVDAPIYTPYWLRGSGGVASALIRFYEALGDDRYLLLARKAAIPCMGFFSVAPHLFAGLASMGETLFDMYQVTGDQEYYDAARLKAKQILLYQIKDRDSIAFPGRTLARISHDYANGGAGIGIFFRRLLTGSRRKFHDLHRIRQPAGDAEPVFKQAQTSTVVKRNFNPSLV